MKPPRTLKAAKRRAWQAITKYIQLKAADDEGYCECVTCGKVLHYTDPSMHTGHFVHGLTVAKDENGMAYLLESNLHPQCNGCNTFKNGALDDYTLYMIDMYGREEIDELKRLKQLPVKMSKDEWHELEEEMQASVRLMNAAPLDR